MIAGGCLLRKNSIALEESEAVRKNDKRLVSFQVSWVRHRDIHLLTVGRYTYTSDQRFEALHFPHTEDWTLRIRYPQRKDSGIYECQISTTPPIGHHVYLTIVGENRMFCAFSPAFYFDLFIFAFRQCRRDTEAGEDDMKNFDRVRLHNLQTNLLTIVRSLTVATRARARASRELVIFSEDKSFRLRGLRNRTSLR